MVAHSKKFRAIVALENRLGIGRNNDLPWRLKAEFAYFQKMTLGVKIEEGKQNAVVMGRKTWESIPLKNRPLKNRFNVIVSSSVSPESYPADHRPHLVCRSLRQVLTELSERADIHEIWSVGGARIYQECVENEALCDRLYITRVKGDFNCDVYFPKWEAFGFKKIRVPEVPDDVQSENGVEWMYEVWERTESTTLSPEN